MSLNEKQRRFVEAYMGPARGNGTEAARLAGYSEGSAGRTAARLLDGSTELGRRVRAAIDGRIAKDPAVMDREQLQRFWTRVARGDETEAGESGEQPARMADRLKASEMLARSQGVFLQRVEHSGEVETGLQVQLVLPDSGRQ